MNAPLHRHADPYATLCRQVRAESERESFIASRMDAILGALATAPMQRTTAYWSMLPVDAIACDMVAWVNETADDPDNTLARALFDAHACKELREQFALARAEMEARGKDFASEAEERAAEERAFEMGGL